MVSLISFVALEIPAGLLAPTSVGRVLAILLLCAEFCVSAYLVGILARTPARDKQLLATTAVTPR